MEGRQICQAGNSSSGKAITKVNQESKGFPVDKKQAGQCLIFALESGYVWISQVTQYLELQETQFPAKTSLFIEGIDFPSKIPLFYWGGEIFPSKKFFVLKGWPN